MQGVTAHQAASGADGQLDGPMLRVEALQKSYRTRTGATVRAIDHYDFGVGQGEFVSVVGPSGCGKSTLLKLVAGLIAPTAGRVLLRGHEVVGPQPDFGMVFQAPTLLKWRSVLNNVLLPIQILRRPRAAYLERAQELLRMTGLEEFGDVYPWELSGGMQQRASICRALIHDPSLLLMDEPFGALDEMSREVMNDQLLRVWSATRKTVIFVTHSIPEAVYLSDHVVVVSPRPSRVVDVVTSDLERPRTQAVKFTPQFAETVKLVRARLGLENG
jgi:NitT/TauT family transport system ATP-binding protein